MLLLYHGLNEDYEHPLLTSQNDQIIDSTLMQLHNTIHIDVETSASTIIPVGSSLYIKASGYISQTEILSHFFDV